jgi:hypothetical protein
MLVEVDPYTTADAKNDSQTQQFVFDHIDHKAVGVRWIKTKVIKDL